MSLATLFTIPFPEIDPVAFSIGPVAVKWYGLAYMAGLLLGWLYIRRLLTTPPIWSNATPPFPIVKVDDLLLYMTIGVIVGGRLGFVLFYEPAYYAANPLDIPAVWKGGMAFHGALLGCGLAIWLFARNNGTSPLSTMDLCAAAVPVGLFFGRIANFINGELYGRPTTMPWGMVFPEARLFFPGSEPQPRHPSQLYEAALEGLALFVILRIMTHSMSAMKRPGLVTGSFLLGYGIFRAVVEILYRQPDTLHALTRYGLTPGAVYSIPMILGGLWLIARARRQPAAA